MTGRAVYPYARFVTVLLLAAAFALTGRTAAPALTLDELVERARSHDARFRAEQHHAAAAAADGWRLVADYGPNVTVSGRYQRSRDRYERVDAENRDNGSASFTEKVFTVGLEQPVIDLEKASRARQGLLAMDVAELRKQKAEETLLANVFERYFGALIDLENQQLAEAETAALETQWQTAQQKLALGFGTITDQHHAEARYRLAAAAAIDAQTAMENALLAVAELIGYPLTPAELAAGRDDARSLPLRSEEQWLALALQHNTDLRLAQLDQDRARLHQRAVQSRFAPALVLFADYHDRRPDGGAYGFFEERQELDFGLRLDLALFAGGRDVADLIARTRSLRAAQQELIATERSVARSVRSLYNSITGTQALIAGYRSAVEANRLALEATQASYNEGVKVLLDVLNAQQDYFRSQKAYTTTQYDHRLLQKKLELLTGTLLTY